MPVARSYHRHRSTLIGTASFMAPELGGGVISDFPPSVRERAYGALQLVDRARVAHLVFDTLLDSTSTNGNGNGNGNGSGSVDDGARTMEFRTRTRDFRLRLVVVHQQGRVDATLQMEPPRCYRIVVRYPAAAGPTSLSDSAGRAVLAGLPAGLLTFAVADPGDSTRAYRTAWAVY